MGFLITLNQYSELDTLMEKSMKGRLKVFRDKERVNTFITMEIFMRVNGFEIRDMEEGS
jgi:hypothetical protein